MGMLPQKSFGFNKFPFANEKIFNKKVATSSTEAMCIHKYTHT